MVERTEGDILVAMDISGKDSMPTEEECPNPSMWKARLRLIEASGIPVPEILEKQLRQLGKKVDALREAAAETWAESQFLSVCWTA